MGPIPMLAVTVAFEHKVRWAAATCLGDLSVFHHQLDLELVLPALHEALNDPEIRSTVDDSLDQIRQNVKTQ
jgi:hypothetical protein